MDTPASQGRDIPSSLTIELGGDQRQRVLRQFHAFPFSSDEAFQQGLSAILDHESMKRVSENEKAELILKSKVFYFNCVTSYNISAEDTQVGDTPNSDDFLAESGNECNQPFSDAERGDICTLTFAELKSLIEHGKTDDIPNNKFIPDTLNDGVPSESTAPLRRKPWEVPS